MAFYDYLIVGNSVAAVAAVEAIREVDRSGSLAVVGEEPHPAYSRPAISYLLTGEKTAEQLAYRDSDFYRRMAVELLAPRRAVAVDPAHRRVTLEDGARLDYGKLLLATGGRRVTPPIAGADRPGVFGFISIADVAALKEHIERHQARRAVVVGGGLIGLQAAEALLRIGLTVTVVELMDRLLALNLDRRASATVEELFRSHGVELFLGAAAKEFQPRPGEERVGAVVLAGGEELPCDLVVLAAGVAPRAELAREAGIRVVKGIAVDQHMATSAPDVYAAGDVAEAYDFLEERARPIPIWPNAYHEGRTAGLNMAGRERRYRGEMAMNALHFFGTPAISVGQYDPPEEGYEVRELAGEGFYRRLVFKGEMLVGLVCVGDAVDRCGIATGCIRDRIPLSEEFKEKLLADFRFLSLPEEWRRRRIRGEA